ncbi:hypothetical protein ElyMa_006882700, partial [Elysia marginata]
TTSTPKTQKRCSWSHTTLRYPTSATSSEPTFPSSIYPIDAKEKTIPELPMTAFRRPTNIRDILVRSTTPSNNSSGFKPCNTP